MFRKILQCVSQPPYVGMKEEEGGRVGRGLARTALRTLCANAECAYIGFHLYCFPFCYLLILWMIFIQRQIRLPCYSGIIFIQRQIRPHYSTLVR